MKSWLSLSLWVFFLWSAPLAHASDGGATRPRDPGLLKQLSAQGILLDRRSARWQDDELQALVEATAALPADYRKLGKPVWLTKDLAAHKFGESQILAGERRGFEIFFYPAAYAEFLQGSVGTDASLNEPDAFRKAYLRGLKRTVVHELTHILDDVRGISAGVEWRRLSGWQETSLLGIKLSEHALNVSSQAFAREYGESSASEDLATYAESYFYPATFSDPERSLKCRTPSKMRFFAKLFPDYRFEQQEVRCQELESWIDPARVQGLEILLASPSAASMASISGHLLLRIKLKPTPGVSGLTQNANDLTIAFGADIPKNTTSWDFKIGGLTGAFLSQMDEQKLSQTVIHYTELEDRDLLRFELILSPGQIHQVLERLFEARKNFRSNYVFLTANCSTMLLDQLAAALERDELALHPGVPITPQTVLARLEQAGLIREATPSFYGLTRRATIAQDRKKTLFESQVRPLSTAPTQRQWPRWDELESESIDTRTKTYSQLQKLALAEENTERKIALYKILLLSLEEEHHRDYKSKDGLTRPTSAHAALRDAVFAVRHDPVIKEMTSRLAQEMEAGPFSADQELSARLIGTAHTGLLPVLVAPAYTITSSGNHLELTFHTAMFEQNFGDPSRFAMGRATELAVLPATMVFTLDGHVVSRWQAEFIRAHVLPETKSGAGMRVKSLFEGGGIGGGIKLLEFSGDQWRGVAVRAKWFAPEVVAALASSEGFRNYLTLSLGLQVGSVWMQGSQRDQSRTWLGLPIGLQGQLSFDSAENTLLRMSASLMPAYNTSGNFEKELQLKSQLSQLLGEALGIEFRLNGDAELERFDDKTTTHFQLGLGGRGF